jgi:UPF0288 family protein (methanogenesis marker protein 3)
MKNELAADTVNGVYICENAAAKNQGESGVVLEDMDFYSALSEDFEGTIYGSVSDEIAEMIEKEYGIK